MEKYNACKNYNGVVLGIVQRILQVPLRQALLQSVRGQVALVVPKTKQNTKSCNAEHIYYMNHQHNEAHNVTK